MVAVEVTFIEENYEKQLLEQSEFLKVNHLCSYFT